MYKFHRIILEPHTFCNRRCDFCTVPYLGDFDPSKRRVMSEETLRIALREIKENIDLFKQPLRVSLFRHNEPLSDIDLLYKFSKITKEYFSENGIESNIHIHTNGDYLTREVLGKLEYIDEMHVNDYGDSGLDGVYEKMNNLALELEKIIFQDQNRSMVETTYGKLPISFYIDSTKDILKTTRGSFVNKHQDTANGNWINGNEERDYPCDMKGKIFVVDYDGSVMGCCEVLSRIDMHQELHMGNVHDGIQSFIDNYDKIDEFNLESCKHCHTSSEVCSL